MQSIGTHMTKERYNRWTVKARILREVRRRIESQDWSFKTVEWGKVQQHPINDDYDGSAGPVLALLDGLDEFTINAQRYENSFAMTMEFSVKPGAKEEPTIMLNLIMGDMIEVLAGDHKLREGGVDDGDQLACTFVPLSFEPEIEEGAGVVRGYLTWQIRYRHRTHRPHEVG